LKVVELAPGVDLRDVADAEVIVVAPRANAMLREVWPRARRVRWVHALAAGVDSLLFPELIASDVVVTNGRGVFADALGEFAVAAMLWFAKDLDRMRRNQRERRWEPFTVERLQGRTAGIIGYGSIGRAAGDRCAALGMNVLALRRTQSDLTLDELLRRSDYVVVATPLTPSTRGMIGAAQLALLAPHAVLINVGRGPVVDEQALLAALPRIRGAALDVFEQEPLPPDHPLWSCENVLLSPHCADHTSDSHQRARQLFADNLGRYERGEALLNVVDKTAGY
jgi:phosphoglycerate dehydrogenase-like enzyme